MNCPGLNKLPDLVCKGVNLQQLVPRFMLLIVLLATALVYRPGLHGPFIFDDGLNIVSNQVLRLHDLSPESLREAAYSVPSGTLNRPLSMLSFAFNFYFDRDVIEPFLTAYSFKATNLAIHLLNGIVIFIFTRLLIGLYRERCRPNLPSAYPEWLALAVSAAWLLHPLNLTGVLYVVQRMSSLAALFVFSGLSLYLWGRARLFSGQRGGMIAILTSLSVFTPLAMLSKENGALLPFFMLAAEVVLFRFETALPSARRVLIAIFIVFAVLPAIALLGYLFLHPDWVLGGYIKRDFNLPERLMTEARVIWFYLRLIVLPNTSLMGIYHDDIAISRHLLDPVTTLPAILAIFALLSSVWVLRRYQPLVAFGILFFVVGHSLESTIFPLELAHEHRNYLPMFGILLAFFHLLLDPQYAVTTRLPRRTAAFLLVVLFAAGTFSRAKAWANDYDFWSAEIDHHPASVKTNAAMGDLYANSLALDPAVANANYQSARHYYEQTNMLKKNTAPSLFGLIKLSELHGKPVEKAWVNELTHSLEHEAIPANTNEHLFSLAACGAKVECPLNAREIDKLMHAPLRNPHVTGRDRALIYSTLAFYFFNIKNDYSAAIEAARHAIELDPQDINHRLWLATTLIALHRADEAREQIALIRQLDPWGLKARDIASVEKQLSQGN